MFRTRFSFFLQYDRNQMEKEKETKGIISQCFACYHREF